MKITKANKLPGTQYLELLDVAKYLRAVYVSALTETEKQRYWRVYTEARANGLRSKMICATSFKAMDKVMKVAQNEYPHLDIKIAKNKPMYSFALHGVNIFVKVKQ
jgi:basic membrane lipoprotein Med (substrate-binding protein (PBP1-ABC) superfamily)